MIYQYISVLSNILIYREISIHLEQIDNINVLDIKESSLNARKKS